MEMLSALCQRQSMRAMMLVALGKTSDHSLKPERAASASAKYPTREK